LRPSGLPGYHLVACASLKGIKLKVLRMKQYAVCGNIIGPWGDKKIYMYFLLTRQRPSHRPNCIAVNSIFVLLYVVAAMTDPLSVSVSVLAISKPQHPSFSTLAIFPAPYNLKIDPGYNNWGVRKLSCSFTFCQTKPIKPKSIFAMSSFLQYDRLWFSLLDQFKAASEHLT